MINALPSLADIMAQVISRQREMFVGILVGCLILSSSDVLSAHISTESTPSTGETRRALSEKPLRLAAFGANIPDRLNYIFDLPWCRRWDFGCISCRKLRPFVWCSELRRNCVETFQSVTCGDFDVPADCTQWSDGCNDCTRDPIRGVLCTAKACNNHRQELSCLPRR